MKQKFTLKDKTIENFDKYVTLFYSKATGNIKLTCGGIQDMEFFGEDKEDYNYDFIVVEKDDFLLSHLENFQVINEEVVLKKDALISKYLK